MKRCLSCNVCFSTSILSCPECGFIPPLIHNIEAFAPEFADEGGGFKSNYFADLARLEETNFWFQCRNNLILWAIEKFFPRFESFLEVGCGTGFVLSGISKKFPSSRLFGSEIFMTGLGFAASRVPTAKFMQMDARKIPFVNEFDVIGAFDVLEHIKEDEAVLSQIFAALKPKGFLLLTVPQHPWLWSSIDEYAFHERRYTASGLHKKIEAKGFRVIKSTSFVSALLPAMMISRIFQAKIVSKQFDATAELRISPWLNAFFTLILNAELALIKIGISLPMGGSRLVIAQKL